MKKSTINLGHSLFYISYFLFLLYAFFGTIEIFKTPLKLLTNISIFLSALSLILQLKNFKKKELIKVLFCLIVSFIFIFTSQNLVFLKLILILILSKNISFEKRVTFDLKLRIIFLLIMILLFSLGIAEDTIALYNGKIRHSIGFTNPNVFGMHMLILCLEVIYLLRDKLSASKIFLCSLIMFISNIFSGSRTALYLYIFSVIIFVIYKKNPDFFHKKTIKKIIVYSPLLTSVGIYILYCLYYNNFSIAIQMDKLLSGRLFNISFFRNNFPISLFGTNIAIANKSCDTAIVYMLFAFGIFGVFLYILSFQKLLKKLFQRDLAITILIFILIIYGISEKLWLFADCNILLTALTYLIFEEKCGEGAYEKRLN